LLEQGTLPCLPTSKPEQTANSPDTLGENRGTLFYGCSTAHDPTRKGCGAEMGVRGPQAFGGDTNIPDDLRSTQAHRPKWFVAQLNLYWGIAERSRPAHC